MINYSRFSLDNGLRVIHNYDPSTAMVAVNLLYNVGSRDEDPSMTGIAHLFEHLMFAGSANIPDFDAEMERAGGINNAWTSNDFTNFYDVAPMQNLETLLWLESDRMLALSFSEKALEVQRNVVIEEFKQTHLNRPYGDMSHYLRALIYKSHPYRYPAIGKELSHIEKITEQDIRNFFYSHYAPNNAVLSICGNVTLDDTRKLVEKWFGDIPRREIAPRKYGQEAPVTTPRRLEVTGKVPYPVIVIAFPMPGYGEEGYIECDMLTDILASGHSSRLYRRLVMDSDLFSAADASIIGSEEPGFLMIKGTLNDNSDDTIRKAEEMLLAQALELTIPPTQSPTEFPTHAPATTAANSHPESTATDTPKVRAQYIAPPSTPQTETPTPNTPSSPSAPISPISPISPIGPIPPLSPLPPISLYETRRAINRFTSDFTFSNVNYLSRAQALALAEMHGEDINSIVPSYAAMTPERLIATATRIINPAHSCTLIYRPIDN